MTKDYVAGTRCWLYGAVPRYAAFLRGVNVGGVNLTMAEVAAALTDAGFTGVRTILASGNVLLDAPARARRSPGVSVSSTGGPQGLHPGRRHRQDDG
jgi:hypothetical protein